MTLFANDRYLTDYAHSMTRSRFDYDPPDHVIDEMMNETYWSTLYRRVKVGDLIFVTDAAGAMMEVRIEHIDAHSRRIAVSVLKTITEKPVTAVTGSDDVGLAVRWRGKRGGEWCVINKDGGVVARDGKSREDAERMMANLLQSKAA